MTGGQGLLIRTHPAASSWRSSSLQPQAAPISLLGSSVVSTAASRRSPAAELVTGPQQQPAMRPGRVRRAAATAELLAGHPLAHLGDHLVGEANQVPVVDHDGGSGQGSADRRGERRRRVSTGQSWPEPRVNHLLV